MDRGAAAGRKETEPGFPGRKRLALTVGCGYLGEPLSQRPSHTSVSLRDPGAGAVRSPGPGSGEPEEKSFCSSSHQSFGAPPFCLLPPREPWAQRGLSRIQMRSQSSRAGGDLRPQCKSPAEGGRGVGDPGAVCWQGRPEDGAGRTWPGSGPPYPGEGGAGAGH